MEKEETKCPRCGSGAIAEGKYLDQIGGGLGQNFRPAELKNFAFGRTDVPVSAHFNACADCGLFWNEIDKERLLKVALANGNRKLKDRIERTLGEQAGTGQPM